MKSIRNSTADLHTVVMWNYIVNNKDDPNTVSAIAVVDFIDSKLDDTMVHHETDGDENRNAITPAPSGHSLPVRYAVADLLRGGREAVLEHGGAEYWLRITANGRLILTK